MPSEKRFTVAQVRGGVFPYYEVRDRDNEVIDGSSDRADMQELADCMNSLSDYYQAEKP